MFTLKEKCNIIEIYRTHIRMNKILKRGNGKMNNKQSINFKQAMQWVKNNNTLGFIFKENNLNEEEIEEDEVLSCFNEVIHINYLKFYDGLELVYKNGKISNLFAL